MKAREARYQKGLPKNHMNEEGGDSQGVLAGTAPQPSATRVLSVAQLGLFGAEDSFENPC